MPPEVVYFNHPKVVNGPVTVEPGRVETLDPVTATRTVLVTDLDYPSGLAVDPAGNLYFGNVTTGPVQVELRKRAPDGTVSSLGIVVDTSAGFIAAGAWAFDIEIAPAPEDDEPLDEPQSRVQCGLPDGGAGRFAGAVPAAAVAARAALAARGR
ncbi:MAG: hypothetical protein ACE5GX_17875, partial [Thermoanaerobaculia bacterium]